MKKLLCVATSLVMVLFLSQFVFTEKVLAAPSNCGTQAFNNQASTAYGSTSAHVKIVVWKACDGGYYASAYTYPDSNGFRFHGTLLLYVYSSGGDNYSSNPIYCNGSPACDDQEVYPSSGDVVHATYTTNNGKFYGCNPYYDLYGSYSFITDNVTIP